MNKFLSRALATSTIVVGLALVGGMPAHAATAVSAVPQTVAGNYVLYYNWGTGYNSTTWAVKANHTFTSGDGGSGTWSRNLRNVTFTYTTGCAVYLGKITKTGFNSQAHPGTMSCQGGSSGTWYALKGGSPQGRSSGGRSSSGN